MEVTSAGFPDTGVSALACRSGSHLSIDLREHRLVFGKIIPCLSSSMAHPTWASESVPFRRLVDLTAFFFWCLSGGPRSYFRSQYNHRIFQVTLMGVCFVLLAINFPSRVRRLLVHLFPVQAMWSYL